MSKKEPVVDIAYFDRVEPKDRIRLVLSMAQTFIAEWPLFYYAAKEYRRFPNLLKALEIKDRFLYQDNTKSAPLLVNTRQPTRNSALDPIEDWVARAERTRGSEDDDEDQGLPTAEMKSTLFDILIDECNREAFTLIMDGRKKDGRSFPEGWNEDPDFILEASDFPEASKRIGTNEREAKDAILGLHAVGIYIHHATFNEMMRAGEFRLGYKQRW